MAEREEQIQVAEDPIHAHCRLQWYRRMQVYNQLVVWLWRALHLSENNYAYLLALVAATNGLIMLFSTLELSALFVLGSALLWVGCAHLLCVLSLTSGRLRAYQTWTDREERDYNELCGHMATVNLYVIHCLKVCIATRSKDPRKFYIVGLVVCILVSLLGSLMSGAVLLHAAGNLLLLLPLLIKHSVVSQVQEVGGQLLHSLQGKN